MEILFFKKTTGLENIISRTERLHISQTVTRFIHASNVYGMIVRPIFINLTKKSDLVFYAYYMRCDV